MLRDQGRGEGQRGCQGRDHRWLRARGAVAVGDTRPAADRADLQWPVDQDVHSIRADATLANGPESEEERTAVQIYTKTGDDGTTGLLGSGGCPRTTSGSRSTARSTS